MARIRVSAVVATHYKGVRSVGFIRETGFERPSEIPLQRWFFHVSEGRWNRVRDLLKFYGARWDVRHCCFKLVV